MQIKKIVVQFETVTDDMKGLRSSWNEKICNRWNPSNIVLKVKK